MASTGTGAKSATISSGIKIQLRVSVETVTVLALMDLSAERTKTTRDTLLVRFGTTLNRPSQPKEFPVKRSTDTQSLQDGEMMLNLYRPAYTASSLTA